MKQNGTGQFLEAELTKEKYWELAIKTGETVFVRPNQLKVFTPED
ncbi:TOBE-like domain-containing protein [Peribacillus frigoritolerans]|nr:TOBE-like domain-containing protein [Peribacillus frigoritolerans]USK68109.1 TOBE-like domain-containing protein [Peribacillus frigoritolerans]